MRRVIEIPQAKLGCARASLCSCVAVLVRRCARASLGSLSEATTVFDAERLKDIIGELGQQLQPLALVFSDVKNNSGRAHTIVVPGGKDANETATDVIHSRFATH